jgi:hypothetical protein
MEYLGTNEQMTVLDEEAGLGRVASPRKQNPEDVT